MGCGAGRRLPGRGGEFRHRLPGDHAQELGTGHTGDEPVYNIEVEGDHCYRVGQQGLLVHNQSEYYRGDNSNLTRLLSPYAREYSIEEARMEFVLLKEQTREHRQQGLATRNPLEDYFDTHQEASEDDDFHSIFVSVTGTYAVACAWARMFGSGTVYTIHVDPRRVRRNRFNRKEMNVPGSRRPVRENEYLIPVFVRSQEITGRDDY